MKIEIQGQDAVEATKELLAIEGLEGSYETVDEVKKGTLVTIATIVGITGGIVGITGGTMTIAEKLYQWNQKYQKSRINPTSPRIEKVLIVAPNGNRLLLKDATIEQIKEILEG